MQEAREKAREKFDDDLLLEQRVRFCALFDLYAPLLTERQRVTCEMMLRDDLSVSELGDELGVTRQGVHDLVRRTRGHLEKIEADLGLNQLLDDLGTVADVLEQYREALKYLERAREIQMRLFAKNAYERTAWPLAYTMEQIADAYHNMDLYEDALPCVTFAYALSRKLRDITYVFSRDDAAYIERAEKRMDQYRRFFRQVGGKEAVDFIDGQIEELSADFDERFARQKHMLT